MKPRRSASRRFPASGRHSDPERPAVGNLFERSRRLAREKSHRRFHRGAAHVSRAAVSDAFAGIDLGYQERDLGQRFTSYLKAFLLLPILLLTGYTLLQPTQDLSFMQQFWRSRELFFFGLGIFLMLGWFYSRLFSHHFLYLYVLGHEVTHALFVYLSLGWVSKLSVSTTGGYILTNKSNLLIALSPYFIPFWSLIVVVAGLLIHHWLPIPHADELLLLLLGGSWCFHAVWTLWMLPRDQPDLQEHGRIYSLSIILLANMILLTVMACLLSPDLRLLDFASLWVNNLLDVSSYLREHIVSLYSPQLP